ILCLNVVYPLVPGQVAGFCAGRDAVLVVEEGQPEYIEQEVATLLRRAGIATPLHGKDLLAMAGEYTTELILGGLLAFLDARAPALAAAAGPARERLAALAGRRAAAARVLGAPLAARPPTFCVGCPERPVFSALSQLRGADGPLHI